MLPCQTTKVHSCKIYIVHFSVIANLLKLTKIEICNFNPPEGGLSHRRVSQSRSVPALPLSISLCTPSPPGPYHACSESPDVLSFPLSLSLEKHFFVHLVASVFVSLSLALEGPFGRRCAGSHKLGCEAHSCLMHSLAKIGC